MREMQTEVCRSVCLCVHTDMTSPAGALPAGLAVTYRFSRC